MENTKHTSGEWLKDDLVSQEMNGDKLFRNHVFVYGANGNPNSNSKRATAYGKTKEECEANARLIASAPDLLEALTEILNEVQKQCSIGSDPRFLPMLEKWQAGMRAIKKATE